MAARIGHDGRRAPDHQSFVLQNVFQQIASLSPNERRCALLLFLYGFGNAASYVTARTVADSSFLSHVGPEHLPEMYMVSAGVVALASLLYGQAVRRLPLHNTVLMTLLILAAGSTVLPVLMDRFASSLTVFASVYLLAQVRGSLGTIQYATLLNEHFAHRQPERVVGLIGAGATSAGISMGLAIGLLSRDFRVESLLYMAAVIDVLAILPVVLLRRQSAPRPSAAVHDEYSLPTTEAANDGRRLRDAVRSGYVRTIAGVVVTGVLVATFVEFQWKVTAAAELNRNEEALARYFGYFYGGVYLVTGALQLFATARVLQQRGVLTGLIAFPTALLLTSGIALIVSVERLLLWPVTLTKGCDTLKRSMHDPSIQVLYGPLDAGLRRQSILFISGMAKPLAEAVAAVCLVAVEPWFAVRHFSWAVIPLIFVWLVMDVSVWRRFARIRAPRGSRQWR